jgi:hypothetical protein
MIYLLELPEGQAPYAWFAYDAEDLSAKLDARGGPPACEMRLWPDEESAVLALEDETEPLWHGPGWRARMALREQLIATEVLADEV